MITRALDHNHDWTFGKGRQNYLREAAAVRQRILTRLWSFLGDCFFDLAAGVDWWNLMGGKSEPAILAQTRSVILGTEGVIRLNSLSATRDPRTRAIRLSYNVDTIYTANTGGEAVIAGNA
ncbi:MAG: hypothetical protein LBK99_19240 [Opitutaceae bacterium]|jgi:hypothetical protein|nr:hypothetical protein [Opitutaceae bacterium]